MGFLGFKILKSNSRVKSKILYLLTNLNLRVFCKNINNVSHTDYSRTSGKLTELRSEEMRKIVEERVKLARSTASQGSSDQVVALGTKKQLNPENLISVFVGYRPVMGRKQDESCMNKYLKSIMVNGLQDPGIGTRSAFIPEGAPLLDYSAVYQERMDSW